MAQPKLPSPASGKTEKKEFALEVLTDSCLQSDAPHNYQCIIWLWAALGLIARLGMPSSHQTEQDHPEAHLPPVSAAQRVEAGVFPSCHLGAAV